MVSRQQEPPSFKPHEGFAREVLKPSGDLPFRLSSQEAEREGAPVVAHRRPGGGTGCEVHAGKVRKGDRLEQPLEAKGRRSLPCHGLGSSQVLRVLCEGRQLEAGGKERNFM